MKNRAYLSLGSNINPEANMRAAFALLAERTTLLAVSTVWETLALGDETQPNYLNCAVIVETDLSALALKTQILSKIEADLGRVREANKFAPRPMDIDIMLFNADVLDLGSRKIPDAEIFTRAFVAIPLAELAPDYVHPVTKETLAEISHKFLPEQAQMRPRPNVGHHP